jgi:hypothetical protein
MYHNTSIPFGFIDETGLTYPDKNQPFLGIGLFKMYSTNNLTHSLLREFYTKYASIKKQQSTLINRFKTKSYNLTPEELQKIIQHSRRGEYKFDHITQRSLDDYIKLTDALFEYRWSFSCVIIDKSNPNFDGSIYKNYWNAYVMYTKLLVKNATKNDTGISIIADFLNQPKSIRRDFEYELTSLQKVMNAMQADSKSLVPLQIVDLLLGAVSFQAKKRRGIVKDSKRSRSKEIFSEYLLSKLHIPSDRRNQYPLAYNFTTNSPCHFNVWNVKFRR